MNRPSPRDGGRGQALAEAALGLMVFTGIIIFGIHFAEVGYLSLKATEAANFAAFDMPFRQPEHNAVGNTWGHTAVASTEDARATNRYQDYDGRLSHPGTTPENQVFTRAEPMQVKCAPTGGGLNGFKPELGSLGTNGNSGASCNATAALKPYGIAANFLQKGHGFFKEKFRTYDAIHVCGVGRYNGGCQGGIPVMLDNWGFVGGKETAECKLGGCANTGFKETVVRAYKAGDAPMDTPGEQEAIVAGAPAPMTASENTVWMSFRGDESGFMEPLPGLSHYSDGKNGQWNTTPYDCGGHCGNYKTAYGLRQPCFLGMSCGKF